MNTGDTAVRKCRWVTLYRGTYGNNRYCGIIITFVMLLSQKMDILSARKKRKSKYVKNSSEIIYANTYRARGATCVLRLIIKNYCIVHYSCRSTRIVVHGVSSHVMLRRGSLLIQCIIVTFVADLRRRRNPTPLGRACSRKVKRPRHVQRGEFTVAPRMRLLVSTGKNNAKATKNRNISNVVCFRFL